MRFVIFISAIIISAAINLEYASSKIVGMIIVALIFFVWDMIDIISNRHKNI